MRRFLTYTMLFIILNMLLFWIQDVCTFYSRSYQTQVFGAEVYEAKNAAKQQKRVKKLIIGDSVCKQLYGTGQLQDSAWSLACNQAITMAGHYCLLYDFLMTNSNFPPEQIVLYYDPTSLMNNLDKFSFQYFLKPFGEKRYKQLLTNPELQSRIRTIPYWWTSQLPIVRNNSWTPKYESQVSGFSLVSPISLAYLDSIRSIAERYQIPFYMCCNPLRASRKELFQHAYFQAKENGELGSEISLLENWFQSAIYLPDSVFQDEIHFKKEYIPYISTDDYSLILH